MADGLEVRVQGNDAGVSQALILELATDIVAAYVGKNSIVAAELPNLIREVHSAIGNLNGEAVLPTRQELKPAVPVKKSVTDEYIICLEDGKRFKSLKRHLRAKYGMTPEEYREKWGLGADYPMVAPSYARERSRLAKKMGLGQSK